MAAPTWKVLIACLCVSVSLAHEANEETLPRFGGQHWFVNIGGKLAINPISSSNHPVFPFPVSIGDVIDCENVRDRTSATRVEESWREIAV